MKRFIKLMLLLKMNGIILENGAFLKFQNSNKLLPRDIQGAS